MATRLTGWRSRSVGLLLGTVLAAGCRREGQPPASGGGEAPPPPAPAAPSWAPDPAVSGELGEPVELLDFTLRLPKVYALTNREEVVPGGVAASWQAPEGPPPVGPRVFAVMIIPGPEGEPDPPPAQLRRRPGPHTGLVDYTESAAESGLLAGRTFERVTTTCRAVKTGRVVRGFQSAGPGKPNVLIMYQGAEADEQSFRVAEAAARSLRRK
jgi:hypothetical protein